MAGSTVSAEARKKRDADNAKVTKKSVTADPNAGKASGKKSKLHHSKGKKK